MTLLQTKVTIEGFMADLNRALSEMVCLFLGAKLPSGFWCIVRSWSVVHDFNLDSCE